MQVQEKKKELLVKTNLIQKENRVISKKRIWKQSFFKDDKLEVVETDMNDLSEEHIHKINKKIQFEMIQLQNKMNKWEEVLSDLEEVAKQKGIKLTTFDNKYFESRKQVRNEK